jgi:hypothetical protein
MLPRVRNDASGGTEILIAEDELHSVILALPVAP